MKTKRTEAYPETKAVLAEYQELFEIALTWTPDPREAQALVERYYQGRLQAEQIQRERASR